MTGERVERRLAAVLAADVAGYSRLMGADEEGTLARLKTSRTTIVDPAITEHRGRIVKTTGDGMLVEFASAVDAARCAVEVQRAMARHNTAVPRESRIEFRVGIHVGDIIIDGGDIFGDGVNIAARLEGIAEPGGICISDDAHRQVRGKVDIAFDDMGTQTLKNIVEPMRAWRILISGTSASEAVASESSRPLTLPDSPSIAVLPFQNMSGDPEQEYFADGIVEDIITALSRFKSLFVIARNSSFTYKGRAVDIKQVGRELGVRYVLEGSIRKAAGKVRITGQLIDATTGVHLWADRFDGSLEDVFELQDQMTTSVVGAVAPKVNQAEIDRMKCKTTGSLDAYDYYLRGVEGLNQRTRESVDNALRFFHKALEIDPGFAAAFGAAARCYTLRQASGWMKDRAQEIEETSRLAHKAVEFGKDDALALSNAGVALAYVVHDFDAGTLFVDRALTLNSNLASAWYSSGWLRTWLGEPELAISHFARSLRMSPLDPLVPMIHAGISLAHTFSGNFEEAVFHAETALSERPQLHQGLRAAAVSNALVGRTERARKVMASLRQLDPSLRISNLSDLTPLCRQGDFARYAEGMRLAGLPE